MAGAAITAAPKLFSPAADPWQKMRDIERRIKAPVFADRSFNIRKYGAVGDGITDCTAAIRKAIEACARAGGGRVIVPEGSYLTGPIHLLSQVNLVTSKGSIIKFSRDVAKYLPAVHTRWEGVELMGLSALIYAYGKENIAVTGEGILDGQADCDHWWPWKGKKDCGWKAGDASQDKARKALFDAADRGVGVSQRIYAEESYLRPQFIQPYQCRNILIEGVTIINSPMWELHPVLSSNVTIKGVRIKSHGPNNDGCDPESCTDVLIDACEFDTGDDCIAIKSGRNTDGRRLHRATENVIIRNCKMIDGHGGVTIGSEISGDVRNVFIENCKMDSPHLERGLRIKSNCVRGGVVENVYMRNVEIGQVSDAVVSVDFQYEEGDAGDFPPVVRNIQLENVRSNKSKYGLFLRGSKKAKIQSISLSKCKFENAAKPDVIENAEKPVIA